MSLNNGMDLMGLGARDSDYSKSRLPSKNKKFTPGSHCPDPVPSADASTLPIVGFKPNEGFSVDPVPARSA